MKAIDRSPLIIVVNGDSWGAFGKPGNLRHMFLMAELNRRGGINESVTDGTYEFNVTRRRFKLYASLMFVGE